MRTLTMLALILFAGCVSSKARIESGEQRAREAVATIQSASARGSGALEGVVTLVAEPTISTAIDIALHSFSVIDAQVETAGRALSDVREGTKGVKDKRGWFARLFAWGTPLAIAAGIAAFVYLGGWPIVVMLLRWLRARGKMIGRKVSAQAELLKKSREAALQTTDAEAIRRADAAVANARADPHFDAAWRSLE